ncbi:MAG: DnaJ family domain-containing protein [Pseudomonadota bacterium]
MNIEDKRAQRLQLQEDHIGRALRDSEQSGELKAAPSYGKPLGFGDGYDETPPELRMAMKVLKDAGVVPHEISLMREAAALQVQVDECSDASVLPGLRRQLAELQQNIAMRLERLRISGAL